MADASMHSANPFAHSHIPCTVIGDAQMRYLNDGLPKFYPPTPQNNPLGFLQYPLPREFDFLTVYTEFKRALSVLERITKEADSAESRPYLVIDELGAARIVRVWRPGRAENELREMILYRSGRPRAPQLGRPRWCTKRPIRESIDNTILAGKRTSLIMRRWIWILRTSRRSVMSM